MCVITNSYALLRHIIRVFSSYYGALQHAKVKTLNLPGRFMNVQRKTFPVRQDIQLFLVMMWWRNRFSPRHNFFSRYTSRRFGAERGLIISYKNCFILAGCSRKRVDGEKWDGGPGCVSVKSAVITVERGAAEWLCTSPCLQWTTPPTFSKETRSCLLWCLTEKKNKRTWLLFWSDLF